MTDWCHTLVPSTVGVGVESTPVPRVLGGSRFPQTGTCQGDGPWPSSAGDEAGGIALDHHVVATAARGDVAKHQARDPRRQHRPERRAQPGLAEPQPGITEVAGYVCIVAASDVNHLARQ